jgi:hypothetical protein
MAINFNPNIPSRGEDDDELVIRKLGGLMLGDPEAFDEQPKDDGAGYEALKDMFASFDEEVDEEVDEDE